MPGPARRLTVLASTRADGVGSGVGVGVGLGLVGVGVGVGLAVTVWAGTGAGLVVGVKRGVAVLVGGDADVSVGVGDRLRKLDPLGAALNMKMTSTPRMPMPNPKSPPVTMVLHRNGWLSVVVVATTPTAP